MEDSAFAEGLRDPPRGEYNRHTTSTIPAGSGPSDLVNGSAGKQARPGQKYVALMQKIVRARCPAPAWGDHNGVETHRASPSLFVVSLAVPACSRHQN